MKTAMQELMDKIQYSIDVQSGVSLTETQVNTLKTVMLVAENLLETEKEQIIDAYYGNIDGVYGYREAGEEYYNQLTKTNNL
jgi:peptide deformylase